MIEQIEKAIQAQIRLNELDARIKEAKAAREAFISSYCQDMKSLYDSLPDPEECFVHALNGQAWLICCQLWDDHHHAPVSIQAVRLSASEKSE